MVEEIALFAVPTWGALGAIYYKLGQLETKVKLYHKHDGYCTKCFMKHASPHQRTRRKTKPKRQ